VVSAGLVVRSHRAEAGGTIDYRSASSASNGTATSLTIKVPKGVESGDVMVAAVAHRDSADWTRPDGWTRIRGDGNTGLYYKVAGADEPSSYTWTLNQKRSAVGIIVAYSGVDTTNPIEGSSGQFGDVDDQITAPSLKTTIDHTRVIGFYRTNKDTTISKPAAMTERIEIDKSSSKVLAIEAAD